MMEKMGFKIVLAKAKATEILTPRHGCRLKTARQFRFFPFLFIMFYPVFPVLTISYSSQQDVHDFAGFIRSFFRP